MHPLLILAIGVAVVLGMILVLRLNAFFALITAALVVSLLASDVSIEGSGTETLTLTGTKDGLDAFLSDPANIQYQHGTLETSGEDANSIRITAAPAKNEDAETSEPLEIATFPVNVVPPDGDSSAFGRMPGTVSTKQDKSGNVDLRSANLNGIMARGGELTVALKTRSGGALYAGGGLLGKKVTRAVTAFGDTAGKIGIAIAMAAVIGSCLTASGAADRVVLASLGVFGEKRGSAALASSGFILAVPVFFDTVFYLLVPLARSMFRRTKQNYLKYLLAIGIGGAVAHTLVPPTPGPLLMADQLGVDMGLMILIGSAVGLPAVIVGLFFARWLDSTMTLKDLPQDDDEDAAVGPERPLPGLAVSLLPIVLPVILIATNTIVSRLVATGVGGEGLAATGQWTEMIGNPNLALLISAAIALVLYNRQCKPTIQQRSHLVESALMSAGVIILITAGGGAFGGMLKVAQVGTAIERLFAAEGGASGFAILWLGFGLASLLKVSQGSSTVAMITGSAILAAMIEGQTLAFHPVYLATAIGCGSIFGVWMNDSGFWIFCKMGGLTETEALKCWSTSLALCGFVGMLVTLALAAGMPMTPPSPGG